MSRFSAALERLSGAVDRRFGEEFRYVPSVKQGGRWVPDPSREAATITGVFVEPNARAASGTGVSGFEAPSTHRSGAKPDHTNSRPRFNFAASALEYRPEKDDRLQQVDTGKWFAVAEVRPDGALRITLDLNG